MRVVAIDPGTQCGYAFTDDGRAHAEFSGVWNLKPKRFEGGGMRFLRMRKYFDELTLSYPLGSGKNVMVVFEEVRRHRGTDAAHIYGGIIAIIASACELNDIPYQGIPVGTIKKHATGKGNANKKAMVEAAQAKFGPEVTDDNRADALWILDYALTSLT